MNPILLALLWRTQHFFLHLKNGMVENSSARRSPYKKFHARSYFSEFFLTVAKLWLQFEPVIGIQFRSKIS